MDETKMFEWKVGLFVLIGMIILFIIVFSIGDISFVKQGYRITVVFNFAAGIGPSSPVRLAGIGVGEVVGVGIYFDEKEKKSKARVYAWIKDPVNIEEDATVTINTLGLLGEKYLEIIPGTEGKRFLKNGDEVVGRDPMQMEKVTENIGKLVDSFTIITERLKNGEGTIGKLLIDATLYDEVTSFVTKLNSGQGTIPKLLTDDKIYKDLEAFVADLKAHPWKLLSKPRGY